MTLLFNPITNVVPGAVVETERVTISAGTNLPLRIHSDSTLGNLKFFKNGQQFNKGTSTTVSQGDIVWITGTAAGSYSTPTFVNITLETVGYMSFVVLTKNDPATLVLDPAFVDRPLADYLNGYTPTSEQNKLIRVTTSNDAATVSDLNTRPTPAAGTIGDGLPYVFVADYVENKVHRVSPHNGLVVQSIDINKPYGLGYTPTEAVEDNLVPHTLITSPVDNVVYVYDGNTHEQKTIISTGNGPYGVCGEPSAAAGDYGFWVACFDSDRVEHWYYQNGTSLLRDFYYQLTPGSGPYDIKVDAAGNAFVSCLISDKVAKCPAGGNGTVSYVSVGRDPWGLCVEGNYVYVACAADNSIYAVHIPTMQATDMPCFEGVAYVEVVGNKLYAGGFTSGVFNSYTLLTPTSLSAPTNIPQSTRLFEGLIAASDDSTVFAVNLHNDAPNRLVPPDNSPDNIALFALNDLSASTPVQSNNVFISGVLDKSFMVVPSVSDSPVAPYIAKNDTNVGQSTTVANSDTIYVGVTTPVDPNKVPKAYIPLVYDGGVAMWILSMRPKLSKLRIGGWIQGG